MVLDSLHRHSLRPAPPLAKFALLLMVTAALMAAGFCSSPAEAQTLSSDADLGELSVSPKNIIGFDAGRTSYEVGVNPDVATATVTATANHIGASVAFNPTDAETGMALSAGANSVTVRVTAEDGTTKDYTVSVNRGVTDAKGWQAGADLDGLDGGVIAAGAKSSSPTRWRAVRGTRRACGRTARRCGWPIYASWSPPTTTSCTRLRCRTGRATPPRTSTCTTTTPPRLASGPTGRPCGWSTLPAGKLFAYKMSDGSRGRGEFAGKDITLASDNTFPAGVWSDGTTVWVARLRAMTSCTRMRCRAGHATPPRTSRW